MTDLVTGASSGLGAYLAKQLAADRYDRQQGAAGKAYETIIHCAFGQPAPGQSEADYIDAAVQLAKQLIVLPHQRFVFISSVDVNQSEPTAYAQAKSAVEKIVGAEANQPLILRAGLLIGPGMRRNQLIKVAAGDKVALSLAADSTFGLVHYSDILAATKVLDRGVSTILPARLTKLGDVARHFDTSPQWGRYCYQTHAQPEPAVLTAIPALQQSPLDRLDITALSA